MGCGRRRYYEDDYCRREDEVRRLEEKLDNILFQLQRQAQWQDQDQEQDQDQRQRQFDFDASNFENIGNPSNKIVINNEANGLGFLAAILVALSLLGNGNDSASQATIVELINLLRETSGTTTVTNS
ncbi:hypothetical protein [Virgibacillus sediminis]|uniref:Uncharacterized protein n=1 Tax=Virgibacillus sediminis TaxID=202260 RepID=A0ABV7A2Z1_9BACI